MTELEYIQQALARLRSGERSAVTLTQHDLEVLDKKITPEEAEPLFQNDTDLYRDEDGVLYYAAPDQPNPTKGRTTVEHSKRPHRRSR